MLIEYRYKSVVKNSLEAVLNHKIKKLTANGSCCRMKRILSVVTMSTVFTASLLKPVRTIASRVVDVDAGL